MSKKQYEVLKRASLFLEKHNREPRVAELLLQHHLGLSRTEFFLNMREDVPDAVYEAFRIDVEKHALTGVPLQHLTGYEEFYGRRFAVNKHVLIPRPETEELVQHVVEEAKRKTDGTIQIVDVGTGSGIIAITLALELSDAVINATDISLEALEVAKENAANLGAKVNFYQGDFLEPLIHQQITVDILVSNPPYIAESERKDLSDTVKYFDPEIALFADDNGLAAYRKIISQAQSVLKPEGLIAFEIGYTQGEAVKQIVLEKFPECHVEIVQDINKKDRMLFAKLKK